MRGPLKMPDAARIETHQTGTGEVRGHGVVSENYLAEISVSAVQRPVAFHGNDTIRNDEVHWHCGTDIENAPMDALPMQNILGPAILRAGHYAKHILHTQRNAS